MIKTGEANISLEEKVMKELRLLVEELPNGLSIEGPAINVDIIEPLSVDANRIVELVNNGTITLVVTDEMVGVLNYIKQLNFLLNETEKHISHAPLYLPATDGPRDTILSEYEELVIIWTKHFVHSLNEQAEYLLFSN